MPEVIRMWMEVIFDILYLVVIWFMVFKMYRRRSIVNPENRHVARLVMIAFALLALGDTGHVGFRVVSYAIGDPAPHLSFLEMSFGLQGIGSVATAITVTLFYVLMVAIWRYRFDKQYGPFQHLLFVIALVRLILLALPINQWDSLVPLQPWSTIRNIPLLVQGLVAFLILRDARVKRDRAFWWVGIMIIVSFACYIPVILFVQQVPLIGMLMIPKTITYVVVCFLAYHALYKAHPVGSDMVEG